MRPRPDEENTRRANARRIPGYWCDSDRRHRCWNFHLSRFCSLHEDSLDVVGLFASAQNQTSRRLIVVWRQPAPDRVRTRTSSAQILERRGSSERIHPDRTPGVAHPTVPTQTSRPAPGPLAPLHPAARRFRSKPAAAVQKKFLGGIEATRDRVP